MSTRAVSWAIEQETGDSLAKLILIVLGEEATRSGIVVGLHQRAVAKIAETTRSTVARKMKQLRDLSLVEQRWPGQNDAANLYYLRIDDRSFNDAIADLAEDNPRLLETIMEVYPPRGGPSVRRPPRTDTLYIPSLGPS